MKSCLDEIADWETLARSKGYCVKELAKGVHISERELLRYFNVRFGRTPRAWLRDLRIKHANGMLADGKFNIKEISFRLALKNPASLSHLFKRETGQLPSQKRSLLRSSRVGSKAS